MAINFPAAPVEGAIHVEEGASWKYTNGRWITLTYGADSVLAARLTAAEADIAALETDTANMSVDLLGSATLSGGVSVIDFTGLNTSIYRVFRMTISNARPVADGGEPWLRLATASTGLVRGSTGDYTWDTTGITGVGSSLLNLLGTNDLGNASGEDGLSLEAMFYGMGTDASGIDLRTEVVWTGMYWTVAGVLKRVHGAGALLFREANNGIRLAQGAGGFSQGTVRLYGMRNA